MAVPEFKRSTKIIIAMSAFVLMVILAIPLWVPGMGSFLVVEDELEKTDVIVILGGGDPQRAKVAAQLFKDGWAKKLITTGELIPDVLEALDKPLTHAEVSARIASREGVPPRHIMVIEKGTSTFEEAEALKKFMKANEFKGMIVVTSIYHTRRSRAVFRKFFKGSGIKVIFRPARGGKFKVEKWWTREDDLIFVNNEYVKLIMYLLQGKL